MTMRFSDIEVGDAIAPLTKPAFGKVQLALYASAGADHNPIHLDEEAARGAGLPGVIAHGMLTMAFLGELLTDWVPPRNVRSLSARFTAMALLGDTVRCAGTVTGKAVVEGENRVELELVAENQKGEKIQLGKAVVALP